MGGGRVGVRTCVHGVYFGTMVAEPSGIMALPHSVHHSPNGIFLCDPGARNVSSNPLTSATRRCSDLSMCPGVS